jgi:serine protease inhibitor
MMVGRFKIPVGYSSDLECRIAELPFSSRRVSFFIILPDDVDRGITKLEANMSSDNIKALFSTLKVVNIDRNLQKFVALLSRSPVLQVICDVLFRMKQ